MRVIISGGGTGGHLYPAISIANGFKESVSKVSILFVGAHGKIEMDKVPAAGYSIVGINIAGFQRRRLWSNLSLPFKLISSLWTSRKILREFRPDVVIGTGGYVSAPIVYMAAKLGIPTLIHEQNSIPGATNKFLANYVDKICVGYQGMEQYFPAQKVVRTGNPVREDLMQRTMPRDVAFTRFALQHGKPCLLVLGGSLGAKTINESILQGLDQLLEAGLQLIWVTGEGYFEQMEAQLTSQQRAAVRLYAFIDDIHLAYAAADMVVSRAGAGTIAELSVAQKPTIFVPSPNVTDDHQTHNAQPFAEKSAAIVLKDSDAPGRLVPEIISLSQQKEQQKDLAKNMGAWAEPYATFRILQEAVNLVLAGVMAPLQIP